MIPTRTLIFHIGQPQSVKKNCRHATPNAISTFNSCPLEGLTRLGQMNGEGQLLRSAKDLGRREGAALSGGARKSVSLARSRMTWKRASTRKEATVMVVAGD